MIKLNYPFFFGGEDLMVLRVLSFFCFYWSFLAYPQRAKKVPYPQYYWAGLTTFNQYILSPRWCPKIKIIWNKKLQRRHAIWESNRFSIKNFKIYRKYQYTSDYSNIIKEEYKVKNINFFTYIQNQLKFQVKIKYYICGKEQFN